MENNYPITKADILDNLRISRALLRGRYGIDTANEWEQDVRLAAKLLTITADMITEWRQINQKKIYGKDRHPGNNVRLPRYSN